MTTLPEKHWRCFHCDEVFTDRREAALHFGASETQEPLCVINSLTDGDIWRALRQAEDHAAEMLEQLHLENTEMYGSYQRLQSRYAQATIAAEQRGYEKGLRDSQHEFIALMLATGKPAWAIPAELRLKAKKFCIDRSGLAGVHEVYELRRIKE